MSILTDSIPSKKTLPTQVGTWGGSGDSGSARPLTPNFVAHIFVVAATPLRDVGKISHVSPLRKPYIRTCDEWL